MAYRRDRISPTEITDYAGEEGATVEDMINYFEINGPLRYDFRGYITDLTERGLLLIDFKDDRTVFIKNPSPPTDPFTALREGLRAKTLDYISHGGPEGVRRSELIIRLRLSMDEQSILGSTIEALKRDRLIYGKGYAPVRYYSGSSEIDSNAEHVKLKIVNTLSERDEISLDPHSPISAEDLAGIVYCVMKTKHPNIKEEEAIDVANHLVGFFGYSDRIIDNLLEPEDRDVFYMLEESGILKTEREEITLFDGRDWRIHYWVLDKKKIAEELGMEFKVNNSADVINNQYA